MDYVLIESSEKDIKILENFKLHSIFDYADNLTSTEKNKIKNYVKINTSKDIPHYKNIIVNDKIIGCLLVKNKDDGVLLDEIYLIEKYRSKGIGTRIIKKILKENNIVYLWVYKANNQAIRLYSELGFKIIEETDTRFYMKNG